MISLASLVRLSTIVNRMPSIFSFGLICRLTFAMDCISRSSPFAERNDGWDGMITLSAAARELIGIIPSDGILFTMVDSRTNEAKEIIASLRAHYGEKIRVFGTEIPFSVRAAETSGRGKSIFAHDKNGKVAAAYRSLTKEVLELERKTDRFRDDTAR